MKKLIYLLMAVSLIFTACKKEVEEGCTDVTAINFNPSAEENDGSCLYECNDPYATNYLVTTNYPVCEYEADVVFYLTVAGAQWITNQGVPFLDVYVGNDLAGSMPANAGFTSAVLCTNTDPNPVHFIYMMILYD